MVRTETVLFFSSQPPGSKCSTSVERHGATPSKQKEKCYFDACLKAWMNNDQRVFTCNGPLSATKTTPRWLAILVVNCSYLLYQDRSSGGQHSGGSLLFNLFMFCDGAADDLKAAFALYSFACPLMLTATSIYYLHRWAKKQQGTSKDQTVRLWAIPFP